MVPLDVQTCLGRQRTKRRRLVKSDVGHDRHLELLPYS